MNYRDVPAALATIDERGFDERLDALRLEARELDAAIVTARGQHSAAVAERADALRNGGDAEAAAAAWLQGEQPPPDTAEIDRRISALELALRGLHHRLTANADARRSVTAERQRQRGEAFATAITAMTDDANQALRTLQRLYADAETIARTTRDGRASALAGELGDVMAAAVHRRCLTLHMVADCSPDLAALIATPGSELPPIAMPAASH